MTTDTSTILTSDAGGLGRIELNRPKLINALDHEMVRRIDAALVDWADDPEVQTVLVTGAGRRGLCAGGDIVAIYRDATAIQSGGEGRGSLDFWRDEYLLAANQNGNNRTAIELNCEEVSFGETKKNREQNSGNSDFIPTDEADDDEPPF